MAVNERVWFQKAPKIVAERLVEYSVCHRYTWTKVLPISQAARRELTVVSISSVVSFGMRPALKAIHLS